MPKFKPIRDKKKKEEPPRLGVVGCVAAIVFLMAVFIWMFWLALRPPE